MKMIYWTKYQKMSWKETALLLNLKKEARKKSKLRAANRENVKLKETCDSCVLPFLRSNLLICSVFVTA